ncbi:vomeronasal type-1 receptor 1-like [Choloepus didactylus]|uniref:vomeronasal type-1 receptor 1-like n=1 Tax=Choloepus didactylus TaxID=27675 RepID=UPI00189F8802|nr:vomeronasal type-1 receptor 1-like [Choloepus didactylus]
MDFPNLEMGIIFITQIQVGILGNTTLLFLYNISLPKRHKLRPTDQILSHLVLANFLVIFSKGIPQTVAALGWTYFLDDFGCKLVFYFHRVGRGVSLSTTCLLSGFQAIKLCPNFSRWLHLRIRSSKSICFCCFLSWIFNFLVNAFIPTKISGPLSGKNISLEKRNYGYCSVTMDQKCTYSIYALLYFSIDFIYFGLMVWASSSMMFVLHRYKQRVQQIHTNSLSPRPSQEVRATHTILFLMSSFLFCYLLSSILTLCVSLIGNPSHWLLDTSVLTAACFPTVSPFVLIIRDRRISQFCFACWARKPIFFSLLKLL